jgi:hypothetical protein
VSVKKGRNFVENSGGDSHFCSTSPQYRPISRLASPSPIGINSDAICTETSSQGAIDMQIWKMDRTASQRGTALKRADGIQAIDLLKAALVGLCGGLIFLVLQLFVFKS